MPQCFFITEKQQKAALNFSLDSLEITEQYKKWNIKKKKKKLLNETSDSKFVTRKLNIINVRSNKNYDAENEFIYSIEVLKANLSDYNDA